MGSNYSDERVKDQRQEKNNPAVTLVNPVRQQGDSSRSMKLVAVLVPGAVPARVPVASTSMAWKKCGERLSLVS